MSRMHLHGPKDVRATEVWLYIVAILLSEALLISIYNIRPKKKKKMCNMLEKKINCPAEPGYTLPLQTV